MANMVCKPKYETVYDELRRRIANSSPGTRLPTVRDLMAEFKASQVTIDRALDILGSKKLITRKNGHGIFSSGPSPAFPSQEPLRVTIAVPDFTSSVTEMFLTSLSRKISFAGHSAQSAKFDWRERIIRSLPSHSCDALLILPSGDEMTGSDMLRLNSFNVPVLILDRVPSGFSTDYICTDNIHGGALAAMHLAKLGHRKMAVFVGEPRFSNIEDRISGFVRQCSLLGLPAPQVIDCEVPNGGYSLEASFKFAAKTFEEGRLSASAIFCVSDGVAFGLLHALYEAGVKVPDDVSVVGFDGIPEGAFFNPSLSSVVQDFDAIAANAIDFITARCSGGKMGKPLQLSIPPKMLERKSTAILKEMPA